MPLQSIQKAIKVALDSPITYALLIVGFVATFFVRTFIASSDSNAQYLRSRVSNLEAELRECRKDNTDMYKALLFKDSENKQLVIYIDSLNSTPEIPEI